MHACVMFFFELAEARNESRSSN